MTAPQPLVWPSNLLGDFDGRRAYRVQVTQYPESVGELFLSAPGDPIMFLEPVGAIYFRSTFNGEDLYSPFQPIVQSDQVFVAPSNIYNLPVVIRGWLYPGVAISTTLVV